MIAWWRFSCSNHIIAQDTLFPWVTVENNRTTLYARNWGGETVIATISCAWAQRKGSGRCVRIYFCPSKASCPVPGIGEDLVWFPVVVLLIEFGYSISWIWNPNSDAKQVETTSAWQSTQPATIGQKSNNII